MRILLDIAAYGLGFVNPAGRCGIYRVIDEFLDRSDRIGASDLGLTASRDTGMSLITEAEIRRTHPELVGHWHPAWSPTIASVPLLADLAARSHRSARGGAQRLLAAMAWRVGVATARPVPIPGEWDVLHSFSDALPPASRIAAKARVLTVHDLTPITLPDLHLPITKRVFGEALASILAGGWAICDSHATRVDLLRHTSIPAERTRVIHPAVDARFAPADQLAVTRVRMRYGIGDLPYILCLSSVEPRKNLPTVLRAFERASAQLADPGSLALVVAGPTGWMSGQFERQLAATNARIVRTGFIADEDLPALYSGCRAFAYLSLAEGFGLPPLEAMSCGAAVLASDTTSLPEVVGDAGLMVDPRNEEAIAAALQRLAGDDRLVAELRTRAVIRARSFSWNRFVDEHRAYYEEMIQDA